MQKKSYFSKTLFASNLKRFMPLWLIPTIIGALITFFSSASIGGASLRYANLTTANELFYDITTHLVPALSMVYSIIVCGAVWSFSFSNRSIQFVHSLPLSKSCVFITNLISELTIMAIPYTVCYSIMLISLLVFADGVSPIAILTTITIAIYETLFFTGLSTMIAMMCSNAVSYTVVSIVTEFVFNLVVLVSSVYSSFFLNGSRMTGSIDEINALSPMAYLYSNVVTKSFSQEMPNIGDVVYTVTLEGYGYAAIYGAVGVVMIILSLLLYKKLRSESAGDAFSFEWVKAIMTVFATYVVTLACSEIVSGMLGFTYLTNCVKLIPLTITMIINATIVYMVMKMIIAKTTRVFNKKFFVKIGIIAVLVIACNLAFYNDVFNITTKVPKEGTYTKVRAGISYSNSFELFVGEDDELIKMLEDALPVIQKQRKDMIKLAFDTNAQYLPISESEVDAQTVYCKSVRFEMTYYDEDGDIYMVKEFSLPLNYNNRDIPGTVENKLCEIIEDKEIIKNGIRLNLAGALDNKNTHVKPNYEIWCNIYFPSAAQYVYFYNPEDIFEIIDAISKDVDEGKISLMDIFINQASTEYTYANIEIGTRRDKFVKDYFNFDYTEDMLNTAACFNKIMEHGQMSARPVHYGNDY